MRTPESTGQRTLRLWQRHTGAVPDPPAGRRNSSGLARDLEILELLATPDVVRRGGMRVLRIAEAVGRDKAVVSRALATLADAGLVERDAVDSTYRLGHRLYALAARTSEATLAQRARPALRQMMEATRETAHLCVLRGGNVLTLASEVSPQVVATSAWAGATAAAWRTPSGRVLISEWDRPTLQRWYTAHGHDAALVDPPALVPAPGFAVLDEPPSDVLRVTDVVSLHDELVRIRTRGYALSDSELEQGVVAASAPVRDATGAIVASLNLSAPRSRMGGRLDELGAYVARCGTALARTLGHG